MDKWIPIGQFDKFDQEVFVNRIVFRTVNDKLILLTKADPWRIDKYAITHYIILPE